MRSSPPPDKPARPALAGAPRAGISLVVAALASGVGVAILLTWDESPTTVDALVVQAIRAAGVVTCAWYAVAALISTATLIVEGAGGTWDAGRRWLRRWGPRLVRHVAGAGAVASVAFVSVVAPSSAAVPANLTEVAVDLGRPELDGRRVASATPEVRSLKATATVTPAPVEARPPDTPAPAAVASSVPAATAQSTTYTVRPGDSLWSIAEERDVVDGPGPGATWSDWYEENVGVIGDDPDLIHPGTVLRRPPPAATDAVDPSRSPSQQLEQP